MADDPNLYGYCGGNPVNFTDPTGHFKLNVKMDWLGGSLGFLSSKIEGLGEALSGFSLLSSAGTFFSKLKNFATMKGFKTDTQLEIEKNTKNASKGVSGDKTVVEAQSYLSVMEFDLGTYGPNKNGVDGKPVGLTTKAVKLFQELNGMEQTGVIDPETLNLIKEVTLTGHTMATLTIKAYVENIGSFERPTPGWLTSAYGKRKSFSYTGSDGKPRKGTKIHRGWDIGNVEGTSIKAVAGGRVIFAGEWTGLGKTVVIDHGYGIYSYYLHLKDFSVNASNYFQSNQVVQKGQAIGSMGKIGTGPHLHFAISIGNKLCNYVDPLMFYVKPPVPIDEKRVGKNEAGQYYNKN